MSKPKTIPKEAEAVATLLQKLVRMKAADDDGYCQCVTCGVNRKWNDGMQGGHFISRTYTATKLIEENIHPQCHTCNGPNAKNGFIQTRYTLYMTDMYGRDFVDELVRIKGNTKKWTRDQLADLKADILERIRRESDRLGV